MANKTLELKAGMQLEVLGSGNEVLFRARVQDFDGESMRIVRDDGGKLPSVVYGTEYKLRGFLSEEKTVFYHATIRGSTDVMWKLDELSNWFTWERREFFRQTVSVQALVKRTCLTDGTAVHEKAFECSLLDVSGGGISMVCKATYSVGDMLMVGNAQIDPDGVPFSFCCTVRRAEEARSGNFYGCRFEGLQPGEQDRLIRAIFRLQREETQRLRER